MPTADVSGIDWTRVLQLESNDSQPIKPAVTEEDMPLFFNNVKVEEMMVAFPENGQDSHFVTLAVEPATVLEASNVVSDTMLSQRRLTTATRFFICQIINFDEILNSNFLRLVLNRNLASAFLPPSPNWFSHQPKLALLRLKRFLFRTGVELYKRYTSRYNPLKIYFFFYNFFCLMKRCELRKSAVHSI